MSNNLIAKTYDPSEVEDKIYDMWMKNGYFKADVDEEKEPYCIVMLPPNITGQLHMGHALDNNFRIFGKVETYGGVCCSLVTRY